MFDFGETIKAFTRAGTRLSGMGIERNDCDQHDPKTGTWEGENSTMGFSDCLVSETNGQAELHDACENCDLEVAQHLIENGINVNAKNKFGDTALHNACWDGNFKVAKFLIQHGADVDATDNNGSTPLHNACSDGDLEIARFLVGNKANVCATDKCGYTALHIACKHAKLEVAQFLIQNGANVSAKDADGCTALHQACETANLEVAQFLIQNKADVNVKDNCGGCTALHNACKNGELRMAEFLILNAADVNAKDNKGHTALHQACESGNLDVARFLVQNKADVNATEDHGDTALHETSKNGELKMVQFLLQNGVAVNAKNRNGATALHNACVAGEVDVAKLLLQCAADIHAQDNSGATPLHIACYKGELEVATLLVRMNANVNAADKNGWTALHNATRFGKFDVARFLLDNKADKDARDKRRCTPLHHACEQGKIKLIQLLVLEGADLNARDSSGRTPLDVAMYRKNDSIVALLKKHNARESGFNVYGYLESATRRIWGVRARCASVESCQCDSDGEMDNLRGLTTPESEQTWSARKRGMSDGGVDFRANYQRANHQIHHVDAATPLHPTAASSSFECNAVISKTPSHGNLQSELQRMQVAAESQRIKPVIVTEALSEKPENASISSLHESFFKAAKEGNIDVLEKCVQEGVQVNFKDSNRQGWTALHVACEHGQLSAVNFLLKRTTSIDARAHRGYTPLMLATRRGHSLVAQELLRNGAMVAARNSLGTTALHIACYCGHLEIAQFLLNGPGLTIRDNKGRTAVHYACANGHLPVVTLLLQKNASVDWKDSQGWTPLMLTAWYNYLEVAQLLVASGADPSARDNKGNTPLDIAINRKHESIVKFLSEQEQALNLCCHEITSNLNSETSALAGDEDESGELQEDGDEEVQDNNSNGPISKETNPPDLVSEEGNEEAPGTRVGADTESVATLDRVDMRLNESALDEAHLLHSLHQAIEDGDLAALQSTLNRNSSINVDEVNVDWFSDYKPLHLAASQGKMHIASFLLKSKNASVDVRNERGETPLLVAARYGQIKMLKLLCAHNANIHATDSFGTTALSLACLWKDNTEALTFLLDHGLSVTSQDKHRYTPFHWACARAPLSILKRMLSMGADPTAQNIHGETPLHFAAKEDPSPQIIQLLIDAGACPNVQDREGETALHVARSEVNAQVLVTNGASLDIRNRQGETPLDASRRRRRGEIVQYLQLARDFEADLTRFQSLLSRFDNAGQEEMSSSEKTMKVVPKMVHKLVNDNRGSSAVVGFMLLRKSIPKLT